MRSTRLRKILIALLTVAAIYIVMALVLRAIGLENAQNFIRRTGWWAPVLFILLCATSLIVAPISGSSLFVASGALFGKETGWFLSLIASLLGCSTNFWISRKFGRRVAAYLIGKDEIEKLDRFTQRLRGHRDILGMILVMPLSQDVVSYAVGLTRIPFPRFFVALVISGAAIVAAYIYLGTSLLEAIIQTG